MRCCFAVAGAMILAAFRVNAAAAPALPDLDVTFIERTPRYVPSDEGCPDEQFEFCSVLGRVDEVACYVLEGRGQIGGR